MEKLLIYILQVNVLLSVVYLGYILLLKGLTFYNLNRGYFLVGMLFSFVYPFLDVRSWFARHVEPIGELVDFMPDFVSTPASDNLYSINNVVLVAVAVGVTFFFLRLLIQSASVLRVHWNSSSALWHSFSYRNVRFPVVPFSFLRHIYLYRKQHDEQELVHIFKHELVHTNGLHSLDVLLTELVYICCWYNPLVFLMRSAIHQNLEFLTDQQVLDLGIDRQTYQYNLLHVNRTGLATPITNKFNFKMLKQRIMMMNKKRSSKLELSKYAMLIPVLVLASAAFTVNQVEANIKDAVELGQASIFKDDLQSTESQKENTINPADTVIPKQVDARLDESDGAHEGVTIGKQPVDPLYVVDGIVMLPKDFKKLDPNDIDRIDVLKEGSATAAYGDKGKNGVVIISTKGALEKSKTATDRSTFQKDSTMTYLLKRSSGDDAQPLYVLDGVPQSKGDLDGIDPNSIESISVIKDNSARAIYGEKAKDGVVLISTKNFNRGIKADEKTDTKSYDQEVQSVNSKTASDKKPVVLIDGVVQKEGFDIKTLDPNTIESMHVWKDANATNKYGKAGANGVIELTTKAAAKKVDTKK
ncbi:MULTISPECIES: M56 family metallopeptidase [Sphingobacterium]|uniref:TonB-dependent receptor plug domain-containing protein n=1 Tax=Sphingobacterium populi TaxID=1812824 RepID=A0ABW5UD49_9SPHI|nr:M56 family metallopeptidase [Sphingobacterium sp. CFCC 11742]